MQTIGERLEEARKRKGISIREAADSIKIRGEYLHKFEGNAFDIGLPEIYVRGFLRTYATYLKLPADKLIADYHALGHGNEPRVRGGRLPNRELYGRMEIGAAAPIAEPTPRPAAKPAAVTAAPAEGPPAAPGVPGNETNFRQSLARTPISPELVLKVALWAVGALLVAVLIYAGVVLFSGRNEPTPTTPPSTSPVEAPNGGSGTVLPAEQEIFLVALNPVEVKVVQDHDGALLFQGTLARGERRALVRRGSILVTARLGKDVELEINGTRYKLGFEGYNRVRVNQ